jgi:hypothetical protein
MIVDVEDKVREATQEDIVVFDRALVPAVLAHGAALEGIFPLDGVLERDTALRRFDIPYVLYPSRASLGRHAGLGPRRWWRDRKFHPDSRHT